MAFFHPGNINVSISEVSAYGTSDVVTPKAIDTVVGKRNLQSNLGYITQWQPKTDHNQNYYLC